MVTVWLNGAPIPADTARIDPSDRGFTLADGLFETIRIVGGRPSWRDRHLARLRAGAALLGIPVPFDDPTLSAALDTVLSANAVHHGSARLTLTRGPAPRGLLPSPDPRPTLLITATPGLPPVTPVHAVLSLATRRNQHSPLSRIKSLAYLDAILARREAADRGADDAILLDTDGHVAEASAANLFVLSNGVLATPPVSDGALPGIARGLILERCAATERSLSPTDLHTADAVFLTNALGLRPLISLDGAPLRRDNDLLAELERRTTA
jgi:branched-chain amino acid aminotransferase